MYRAFQCNVCAAPLMSGRRIDYRYCGVRCRVKAHRIRYDGRGLLDVEIPHIVERVIKVTVPVDELEFPAQAPEEPTKASAEATDITVNDESDIDLGESEIIQPANEDEFPEPELGAEELKRQLRESESKAAKLAQDMALLKEQGDLLQVSESVNQELQATRAALENTRAKLAKRTEERNQVLQAADLFKHRLDNARQTLARREAELLQAQKQAEALLQAQQHRQASSQASAPPQAANDAVLQKQRRQMSAMADQIEELTANLTRAKSDQAELAQRREEVARLTAAVEERRRRLLAVTSERDALQSQVANLTQQVEQFTLRLRRHDDGTYHAIASGVVGVAAGLAHAYAEREGINLPPLTPPAAKQAPQAQPPPPPPPPSPPPEDSETVRWRQVIAEQKRRGWDPRADMLVFTKLDELKAEDELARVQEKTGIPMTTRKLLPSMDADFLSQRDALQARVEYHRAHCKDKNMFERATWESEHYRLDVISESNLQRASLNRTMQLNDEIYAVRAKRK